MLPAQPATVTVGAMTGHPLGDWLTAGDTPLPPDDGGAAPGDLHAGERDAAAPRRRRRALVLGAAALPWAVLAIVGLATRSSGDGEDPAPPPGAGDPAPLEDPSPAPGGTAAGTTIPARPGDPLPPAPPGAAASAVHGELAALAAVAVRLELSGHGEQDQDPIRYVDLAVAEGADAVGDLTVVRVLAVVLEGGPDGWSDTRVRRFAVPLQGAPGGYAPAGTPWELPGPAAATSRPLDWQAAGPADPAVVRALEREGYEDVTDAEVSETSDAAVRRVRFTATGPAGAHEVWMTTGPQPRLLGATESHDEQGEP